MVANDIKGEADWGWEGGGLTGGRADGIACREDNRGGEVVEELDDRALHRLSHRRRGQRKCIKMLLHMKRRRELSFNKKKEKADFVVILR